MLAALARATENGDAGEVRRILVTEDVDLEQPVDGDKTLLRLASRLTVARASACRRTICRRMIWRQCTCTCCRQYSGA